MTSTLDPASRAYPHPAAESPGDTADADTGEVRGYELKPLYRSVPFAALADPTLYAFLAVADALRDGAVRDRKVAEQVLKESMRNR